MDGLYFILPPSAIVTPESDSEAYRELTSFWAAQMNLHQRAVLTPPDVESLSKVVKYLYNSDLDFSFRGHGFTSLPTKDILVSLHNLDEFSYDPENQTITVGAGQPWMSVYTKVEEVAPDFTVIGARTPAVGIAGTIITGGFSWLSSKYGCISDPQNMLDCEIVKYDGSIVWASSEPELLWALRGGGGGFGAITRAVFKLRPISRSIFNGTITVPKSAVTEALEELAKFSSATVEPGVSVFMYMEKRKFQGMHSFDSEEEVIVFQVFDPYGEEHGRKAFSWALSLPGVEDLTSQGNMLEIIRLQNRVAELRGTSNQYWAPVIVPKFSDSQLETCTQWFKELENYGKSISDNTYMIFELFCTMESPTPRDLAWPGPRGCSHMLIIGVGCDLSASSEDIQAAKKLARDAPSRLMGDNGVLPSPNAIEEWSDMQKIYGENFEKLVQLRHRYDPKRRFKAHIQI